MKTTLRFPIKGTTLCLVVFAAFLAVMSVVFDALKYYTDPTPRWIVELHRLFNINFESNIPTWYATMLLLLCAIVLVHIALRYSALGLRFARHWWFLVGLFIFASIDEACQIHEVFIVPMQQLVPQEMTAFRYGWTLIYLPLLAVIGLIYLPFFQHLPSSIRRLMFASAAVFIGAAAGFEMIEGWWVMRSGMEGQPEIGKFLVTTGEEVLEMGGAILFFYTLASFSGQLTLPTAPRRNVIPSRIEEALVG